MEEADVHSDHRQQRRSALRASTAQAQQPDAIYGTVPRVTHAREFVTVFIFTPRAHTPHAAMHPQSVVFLWRAIQDLMQGPHEHSPTCSSL